MTDSRAFETTPMTDRVTWNQSRDRLLNIRLYENPFGTIFEVSAWLDGLRVAEFDRIFETRDEARAYANRIWAESYGARPVVNATRGGCEACDGEDLCFPLPEGPDACRGGRRIGDGAYVQCSRHSLAYQRRYGRAANE